jgi:2',3'-cyclic-nucleotide 2'-phosphodiesterase (5'-nucleotidase family)
VATAAKKKSITRKLVHAGGWQVVKRAAKMLPFGGTVIVVGLVGHDIKKKGVVRGVINSSLDAVPFLGFAKNAVELVRGDFIPDKEDRQTNGNK